MVLRIALFLAAGLIFTPSAHAQSSAQLLTDSLGDPLPAGAIARLGTLRFKHTPAGDPVIDSATFSPDGKMIASLINRFDSIRLWDAATGKELPGPWNTSERAFSAVAFSPDGKTLAAAAATPLLAKNKGGPRPVEIIIWNIAAANEVQTLGGYAQAVQALAFADGGKTLVTASNGAFRWWNVATGKEKRSWHPFSDEEQPAGAALKEIKTFAKCSLSADGKFAAVNVAVRYEDDKGAFKPPPPSDRRDDEAVGFDLVACKPNWRIQNKVLPRLTRFAFSADGKRVAIVLGPNKVELRDAVNGKLLGVPPLNSKTLRIPRIGGLALSSDGGTLAVAGPESHILLWNPSDPTVFRELKARVAQFRSSSTESLEVSPDGKALLVGVDADLQLYDVASLKEILPWEGHRGWIDALAFSADGKRLLTASAESNLRPQETAAWDAVTWKRLHLRSLRTPTWPDVGTLSLDGTVFAGKTGDDRFALFEMQSGRLLSRFSVPAKQNANDRGFFSPTGKFFLLAGLDEKGRAIERVYAIPSGKQLCQLPSMATPPNLDPARRVAFSQDDRHVAYFSRSDGVLSFFEIATGKVCQRLGKETAATVAATLAFSPDGTLLASWILTEGVVRVWDLATGKERWKIKPDDVADPAKRKVSFSDRVQLAWSADGRTLALGQHKIRVWELATLRFRCELTGHDGPIRALAYSPNGRFLASGSADTTVLIWDMANLKSAVASVELPRTADWIGHWQALISNDAALAFAAICDLTAVPKDALALLKGKIKPAPAVEPKRIGELIAQLDAGQYAVREKAKSELLQIGDQALPAIDKALAGNPNLETLLRLRELRTLMTNLTLSGENLRAFRAVEILERIGNPDARALLQSLADGGPATLLTTQAQQALKRLKNGD